MRSSLNVRTSFSGFIYRLLSLAASISVLRNARGLPCARRCEVGHNKSPVRTHASQTWVHRLSTVSPGTPKQRLDLESAIFPSHSRGRCLCLKTCSLAWLSSRSQQASETKAIYSSPWFHSVSFHLWVVCMPGLAPISILPFQWAGTTYEGKSRNVLEIA